MPNPQQLITENLNIWTAAIKKRGSQGRGSSKKIELHGIKKLRELILELAVRGLLVPQNPNDEPASVLLEKIAAEKEQLLKDGKIKKQKALPEIGEDEKPFELPKGWEWCNLKELCELENGDRSKNYPNKSLLVDEGVPFVNAGHLQAGRVDDGQMTFITEERFEMLRAGKFSVGDILFCLRGSLGKSAIVDTIIKGAIASSLVIVRLRTLIDRMYIHNYFDSPLSYRQITLYDNGTAQPNLSAADLSKFLVPLPPEAEQPRIVAKVDELMALCDQLEQQTESSLTAHQTLVETLLKSLLDAAQTTPGHTSSAKPIQQNQNENQKDKTKGDPFQQAWQMIWENFDALFTTEHSIDQLKQTILQLAVMGKLVPQDPNDEPASVLLEKIAAEKEQLIKDKKIKKQKPLPEISEDEKPFALPKGWEWVRLPDVAFFQEGPGILAKDFREQGVPLIRISGMKEHYVSQNGCNYLDLDMVKKKWSHFSLEEGDIVLSSSASLGMVSKVAEDTVGCIIYTGLIRFRPYSILKENYLLKFLGSSEFERQINDSKTGAAIKHFGPTHLKGMVIPVPPLSEQPHIVSTVDELMTLCDTLKERIRESKITQLQLADAMAEQALT